MNRSNKGKLVISIAIPLIVGGLSALLSGGMGSYSQINQPTFAPPGFIFPIVWTILYTLMGISSYLIYISDSPEKETALTTYGIQLFFNFFWSIIFFGFHQYLAAFIWLLVLIVLIAIMIYQFDKISPLAAYLQIPYLLWCTFAAVLNFAVYRLNG